MGQWGYSEGVKEAPFPPALISEGIYSFLDEDE